MADHYLSTRREAEQSQAAALASMSGNLREEVNRFSDNIGGVSLQLSEQKKQIAALQDALEAAETHRITQTKQLEWIAGELRSLAVWLRLVGTLIVLLLGGLIAFTIQIFLAR